MVSPVTHCFFLVGLDGQPTNMFRCRRDGRQDSRHQCLAIRFRGLYRARDLRPVQVPPTRDCNKRPRPQPRRAHHYLHHPIRPRSLTCFQVPGIASSTSSTPRRRCEHVQAGVKNDDHHHTQRKCQKYRRTTTHGSTAAISKRKIRRPRRIFTASVPSTIYRLLSRFDFPGVSYCCLTNAFLVTDEW